MNRYQAHVSRENGYYVIMIDDVGVTQASARGDVPLLASDYVRTMLDLDDDEEIDIAVYWEDDR